MAASLLHILCCIALFLATQAAATAFWKQPSVFSIPRGGSTAAANATVPAWKSRLPAPLSSKGNHTLEKIRIGTTTIYLLGTAHVSRNSSADVSLLLESVRPDGVFVELCDARVALLEGEEEPPADANATFREKVKHLKEQGASGLQALSTVMLTSVQEDYADTLGVELGGEFQAAYRYWRGRSGCFLLLGDRPLQLTLARAWESLSGWWPKCKVVCGLVWSCCWKPSKEELLKWLEKVMESESDVLTESLKELKKHFPGLYHTIIAERDAWMAAKLVQTSRSLNRRGRSQTLVAIVGAGHVPGIVQWLTQPTEGTTPEEILRNLTVTRKWANDPVVQNEIIPQWINEVTQLQPDPTADSTTR